MNLILLLFLLTITKAIPLLQNEQEHDENGQASSRNSDKKQLLLHGPEVYPKLPPYSDGNFDVFGHHLSSPINHPICAGHLHHTNMVPLDPHLPCQIHHHEYQFHAPDIDYWWPHHWPPHLPPPFPFHKQKDSKKEKEKEKEKEKQKEKEKDKKKGTKSRK